jgi:YVTN family beta-propeller protein
MHILVLSVLLFIAPSEDGTAGDGFENFEANSGITADQVIPFRYCADADTIADIDPGIIPEGDYLMDITFTTDGSKVLVCNYMSENITVMDWASMTVDTTFSVDGYPGGIRCSDDYAVVAIPFSDRIDVFDLTDYSLAASFPSGEQPWVVRISDDGSFAYVACDIDDCCEVIDLDLLTHSMTITGFPVWLTTYGWGSESSRFYVRFSGFEIVHDGAHLAVGNGDASLLFFNTATGAIDNDLAVPECDNVAISGDGEFLVALSTTNPVALYRVDLGPVTVDSIVTVPGYTSGMTREIAVNHTGSKAYISTSSNTSHLVRFLTGDAVTFSSTYSAFWIGVSPDHSLAVSGQYRYSIIDFATETMVAQYQGNSQYIGCVSPVANHTASYAPTSHEGVYFYSFDGSSVSYLGDVMSGSPVEGDGTRRVAIAPDGSVAVVSNTMSDNVSVINLETLEVIAVLEIGDRVQDVAITSDSRWAVVCGFDSYSVMIIDLYSNTIVANVPAGSRPSVVSITPDDEYAYVGNVSSNTVSVIHLDGASSTEIAEIPCGVIGVSWAACGVTSDVQVSPSGDYCLVAASFDDKVKVIDTATNTIVADLTVGDFPLQIAFNHDGSRALVTNYSGDTYSLIDVDGASSSVVGTWPAGDGPLRVAYSVVNDEFAMGLYSDRAVKLIDPSTGSITETISFASSGSVTDVDYNFEGLLIVLTAPGTSTPCRLHYGSYYDDLSASAVYFDYCAAVRDLIISAVPGPDYAIYNQYTLIGVEQGDISMAGLPELWVSPNPGTGCFSFDVFLPSSCEVSLGVFDLSGRLVSEVTESCMPAGTVTFTWDDEVPAGIYAVRLDAGEKTVSRLMTVCD